MASRSSTFKPLLIAVIAAIIVAIALPDNLKAWAPSVLRPPFHLGLDLAGGTQLDFRISEDELQNQLAEIEAEIDTLEEQGAGSDAIGQLALQRDALIVQRDNLVEAIRIVLERRINALGVSEATITPSYFGNEKHLLVECPGIIDTQVCIDTVGKTIQLEFKEEFTEATEEFEAEVRAKASAAFGRLSESGMTLEVLGQDIGDDLGTAYIASQHYFRDELPAGLESLWGTAPAAPVMREGSIMVQQQNEEGEIVDQAVPGIFLVQVLRPVTQTGRTIVEARLAFEHLAATEQGLRAYNRQDVELDSLPVRIISTLRSMQPGALAVAQGDAASGATLLFLSKSVPGTEEVGVSHILVSYQGAEAAEAGVTRTKEEALQRAQQLRQQVAGGANFADVARAESDGTSAENGGSLGTVRRGMLVAAFEQVAFTQPEGTVSEPVETPFGYHIIRTDKAPVTTPDIVSFDALEVTGVNAMTRAEEIKTRMENGRVQRMEDAITLRAIFFSLLPTGWKDTPLDGKHFRTANVTLDPTTNRPIVQILFDDEGGTLFQELTKRNIGKRIAIFVGGELVSAPTVQQEIVGGSAVITGSASIQEAQMLAQDLNTGAIPAPIHLTGQRTVEATLGAEALSLSVLAAIVGMIVLMLYMILVYRFLGVIADIALLCYTAIFIAVLKLPLFLVTDTYIVLTLAGAAGMILSIGMAVDTNVLVFERVKEELRKGRSLRSAIDTGFVKAWPSIRDSNISTVITCVILFAIGTSIVRGFAVTLGLGVLISMFSGIVISRFIARRVAATSLAEKPALFPGMKS